MARITSRDDKRFVSHGFCHRAARPSLRFSGTRTYISCFKFGESRELEPESSDNDCIAGLGRARAPGRCQAAAQLETAPSNGARAASIAQLNRDSWAVTRHTDRPISKSELEVELESQLMVGDGRKWTWKWRLSKPLAWWSWESPVIVMPVTVTDSAVYSSQAGRYAIQPKEEWCIFLLCYYDASSSFCSDFRCIWYHWPGGGAISHVIIQSYHLGFITWCLMLYNIYIIFLVASVLYHNMPVTVINMMVYNINLVFYYSNVILLDGIQPRCDITCYKPFKSLNMLLYTTNMLHSTLCSNM